MNVEREADVIVVGAGLAGLSCCIELLSLGRSVLLIERSDRAGGRTRTDEVDGFLLDRGFQVLLTEYPSAKRLLNYERLGLGNFYAGASVWHRNQFHSFLDPLQHPSAFAKSLFQSYPSVRDKWKLWQLRKELLSLSIADIFQRPESTAQTYLHERGFSREFIHSFFRPFLTGVFLDPTLLTSSRMLEFVMKMFQSGKVTLPRRGMGAIADQLVAKLPAGTLMLNTRVEHISPTSVVIATGERIHAQSVVLACDANSARSLLPSLPEIRWQSVETQYYAAKTPPVRAPILVLNGEPKGLVNNVAVVSQVQPSYAPKGQSLISVTAVDSQGHESLERIVRGQLEQWFGGVVRDWRLIRSYSIPRALPNQSPPFPRFSAPAFRRDGIICCGDYITHGSIEGALASGRAAAALCREKDTGQTNEQT